jgi:hypothetical protein
LEVGLGGFFVFIVRRVRAETVDDADIKCADENINNVRRHKDYTFFQRQLGVFQGPVQLDECQGVKHHLTDQNAGFQGERLAS